ncbi:MAG: hypothetical protein AOA65_1683 [Candidatus Bathyarchaeota archaeon BA1]|nr:MAG: hypothetical protein AOA65_1683 [Candidatus Bathyarchaeota archaeon BA1]
MAEDSLEVRVARIEGILEQMDKRLNHLESDIAGLRGDIAGLREEMNRRFDGLFKWIVGLILGMWTTTMMTLIPILLKILGVI